MRGYLFLFLPILIAALAGARCPKSSASIVTAHSQVVNSAAGEFAPFEMGEPVLGYDGRLVWEEIPELLADEALNFWRVNGTGGGPNVDYGKISFEVTEPGPVWLAVTNRYENSGNDEGGWVPELSSQQDLENDGWQKIVSGVAAFDIPTSTIGLEYDVFERQSVKGESFTYRTEKYHPPLLLTTQIAAEPRVLFFDDFEQESLRHSIDHRVLHLTNWYGHGVGVDVFDSTHVPEHGQFVRIPGISGIQTMEEFALVPGDYILKFDLGGSADFGETIQISVGDVLVEHMTLDQDTEFQTMMRHFVVNQSTSANLFFVEPGDQGPGSRLDNVLLMIPVPGDLNADGVVGLQDFAGLKEGFGEVGADWFSGDFNGDSQVGLEDFGILKRHFAERISSAAVPEPSGLNLALVAIAIGHSIVSRAVWSRWQRTSWGTVSPLTDHSGLGGPAVAKM